jgi:hypothetical protein
MKENTMIYSEAFRRGFLQRTAEIHGMEKMAVGPMLAMGAKAIAPAASRLMGSQAGKAAPGMFGRGVDWLTKSPAGNKLQGLGVGLGVGSYSTGQAAKQKYTNEFNNALDNVQNVAGDWATAQGYNNPLGQLMAFLSAMFGGKKYFQRQTQGLMQYAAKDPRFSSLNRGILQQRLAAMTATPTVAPAPTPAPQA